MQSMGFSCKIVLALSMVLLCLSLSAQFSDDFSDINLSNRWQGDLSNFRVNSSGELQLDATAAGSSYLSRPFQLLDSTLWEAYFRLEFDPSTSNRLRLWLISDVPELETGNGYYLEVGESGNTDAIRLFKKSGTTRTQLAAGQVGAVALANADARFRLVLDDQFTWKFFADYSGGRIFTEEFSFQDPGFVKPAGDVYFGFHCLYTATRTDLFYFDDVSIGEPEPDTEPPFISDFQVLGSNRLSLRFNETLESSTLIQGNFQLIPAAGEVEVILNPDQAAFVTLEFESGFVNQQNYQLNISGVKDVAGNVIRDTSFSFTYYIFELPEEYDVLFTEIMARPSPPQGLPSQEYFELYNRSDKVIDLADLQLLDGTTVRLFDSKVFLPGEFLLVCSRANVPIFEPFGKVASMVSFPSLTIAGKRLILQDRSGNMVDYVSYTETWYRDRIKQNGGYSLELINPDSPCKLASNWMGSNNPVGGTPGQINSVWQISVDNTAPLPTNAYPFDTKNIALTFDKKIDRMSIMDPSSVRLEPFLEVASIDWSQLTPEQVTVSLSEEMIPGQVYRIFAPGLEDCQGIPVFNDEFLRIGIPEDPEYNDLVINEVLFQAETGGSRFIEVLNRSNKIIDAFPLFIADFGGNTPDGFRTEVQQLIFPNDIVAFTPDPAYIINRYTPPTGSRVVNARVPTLSDRDGNVTIYTFNSGERVVIDELDYSRDFHYALLRDRRGVSIERIDPNADTQNRNNWHSAAEQVGYGTPGYQNSQFRNPEQMSDSNIFFEDKFFSPDGDGFRDFLQINYQLETSGFVANVRIFDSEGRMVRHLVRSELLPASGSFKWDGTNDSGGACRLGIYVVMAELVEPGGTVLRFKEDCVLGGLF